MKKLGVFFALILLFGADLAQAGFGITPPYVRNTSLTRNSIYEQQILLVRGNPDVALRADIVIDAPEFADWIEIVGGNSIQLPRGEQKIPMTVRVTVPSNVAFKEYRGTLRIRTLPADDQVAGGAVSVSLGAQVDINLNVIDREIRDFRVRRINVSALNEGHKLAWLYFPGKINFGMLIENTGNVDISPSRVEFRIFDYRGQVLLEETTNLGKMKRIAPYATEEIFAHLPTRLPAGSYSARFRIYNGEEVKQEGEVNLSVQPFGTLQEAGFGFAGLSIPHKISVLLPIFILIILVLYFVYNRRLRLSKTK